ncbi:MAG: GMP synthase subunit A [Methanobrevibacter sp.]|jgi:GMP synthase (glutamine-hydrolysing)|nr:GMP synthase subunit A [Candidatus Methanoflexus mossambicus]
MKILVINNHGQYNHRILRSLKDLDIPAELVSNELSLEEILEKDPIGIILGGGPDIDGVGNSEEYINNLDLPILGICLGHQLLAKSFGGKIATADNESYATIEINIDSDDAIFKDLGDEMEVYASHKDEVTSLPCDFNPLASSNICEYEAIKHKDKPFYGIQFHPEVHHTPKGDLIFKNFHTICKNYNSSK